MRRLLLFAGLVLLGCTGCTRVLFVGDSLTLQFGPYTKPIAQQHQDSADWVAQSGTDPCDWAWDAWVRDHPWARIDYVVIEDYHLLVPPTPTCPDAAAYEAGWARVAAEAHAKGALVIELATPHPDLSAVEGIDIRGVSMVPADGPDGIHYLPAGAQAQAQSIMDYVIDRATK